MLVKICGVTTEEAFDAVVESAADLAGFVFFSESPRHLEQREAIKFRDRSRGKTKKVAVVSNPSNTMLLNIIDCLEPDIIQLHGSETPDRVYDIKTRFNLPIIKALTLFHETDMVQVSSYDKYVSYLLFDSISDSYEDVPIPFDWSWLKGYNYPYFLAGGLTADNVTVAVKMVGSYCRGVDVSSGVEERPGVKSPSKIKQFVQRVREAIPEAERKAVC